LFRSPQTIGLNFHAAGLPELPFWIDAEAQPSFEIIAAPFP
jgi:hypothetical protein